MTTKGKPVMIQYLEIKSGSKQQKKLLKAFPFLVSPPKIKSQILNLSGVTASWEKYSDAFISGLKIKKSRFSAGLFVTSLGFKPKTS